MKNKVMKKPRMVRDWDYQITKSEVDREKRRRIYELKKKKYAESQIKQRKKKEKERAKRKKIFEKRLVRVIKMREKAMTYEQIAQKVGVTRERVRQIGVKARPDLFNGKAFLIPLVEVTCRKCGKKRVIRLSLYETNKDKKFYCSRTCRRKYPSVEARVKAMNERKKEHYHASPSFRKKLRTSANRWRENLKKDKNKWLAFEAKNKKYQAEYRQQIKNDPVRWKKYTAKIRAYNQKRYLTLKKDPTKLKTEQKKQKDNYRKYYWKVRRSQYLKNKEK
jgi:hypothetical protein